jgi:hypothetical protein
LASYSAKIPNWTGKLAKGDKLPEYLFSNIALYCIAGAVDNLKVAVPAAAVPIIFEDFHTFLLGGHLGIFQ